MPKGGTLTAARRAAQRLADEMGYAFIDAELNKEHGSVFLRIFIEHEQGVDLARCEAFHRQLNPLVNDLNYDFLEVSSPGIDRPLKTEADFARRQGTEVVVKLYRTLEGKKEFCGTLIGLVDGEVVLETLQGEMRIARKDCALVKPAVNV